MKTLPGADRSDPGGANPIGHASCCTIPFPNPCRFAIAAAIRAAATSSKRRLLIRVTHSAVKPATRLITGPIAGSANNSSAARPDVVKSADGLVAGTNSSAVQSVFGGPATPGRLWVTTLKKASKINAKNGCQIRSRVASNCWCEAEPEKLCRRHLAGRDTDVGREPRLRRILGRNAAPGGARLPLQKEHPAGQRRRRLSISWGTKDRFRFAKPEAAKRKAAGGAERCRRSDHSW